MSFWDFLFGPRKKRPSRYGETKRTGELYTSDRAETNRAQRLVSKHRIDIYTARRILLGETVEVDGKKISTVTQLEKLRPPIKEPIDPFPREKPRDRRGNERPQSLRRPHGRR